MAVGGLQFAQQLVLLGLLAAQGLERGLELFAGLGHGAGVIHHQAEVLGAVRGVEGEEQVALQGQIRLCVARLQLQRRHFQPLVVDVLGIVAGQFDYAGKAW